MGFMEGDVERQEGFRIGRDDVIRAGRGIRIRREKNEVIVELEPEYHRIEVITRSQYDMLIASSKIRNRTLYFIKDRNHIIQEMYEVVPVGRTVRWLGVSCGYQPTPPSCKCI